jgi:transposase
MFGSHVLLSQFAEHFRCEWFWPPYSPDMNTCDYILWSYIKNHVYSTNPHTNQKLQVEIKAVSEEIAGDVT